MRQLLWLPLIITTLGCGAKHDDSAAALASANASIGELRKDNSALRTRVEHLESLQAEDRRRLDLVVKQITEASSATVAQQPMPSKPSNGDSARVQAELNALVAAVNQTTGRTTASGPTLTVVGGDAPLSNVSAYCKREWPDSFRMQQSCEQSQRDAKARLDQRTASGSGVWMSDFANIRTHCQGEWPENYRMQDDCETREIASWKTLHPAHP